MGFDPERVAKVLELHSSVQGATDALLDSSGSAATQEPSPPPPRVSSDHFLDGKGNAGSQSLGAPPSQPPPPPPPPAAGSNATATQQAAAANNQVSGGAIAGPLHDLLGADGPDLISIADPVPASCQMSPSSASSRVAIPILAPTPAAATGGLDFPSSTCMPLPNTLSAASAAPGAFLGPMMATDSTASNTLAGALPPGWHRCEDPRTGAAICLALA